MPQRADPLHWLRRRADFAVLLSVAVVIHVLEGLFPVPLPLPGAKLGLASLVVVVTMLHLGYLPGIVLAASRSLLGSLVSGTLLSPGFVLGLGGGVVSAVALAGALRWASGLFSLIGISIIGAVVHNLTQLALAWALYVRADSLLYYLPAMILLGMVSGTITGLLLRHLSGRLPLFGFGHAGSGRPA